MHRGRSLPAEIPVLELLLSVNREMLAKRARFFDDEVSVCVVETHHPAVQEPALAEQTAEWHVPVVVHQKVGVGCPFQVIEWRQGERDRLYLSQPSRSTQLVGSTLAATAIRDTQSFACPAIEDCVRSTSVDQRPNCPLAVAMLQANVYRWSQDCDERPIGALVPVLFPIAERVVPGSGD